MTPPADRETPVLDRETLIAVAQEMREFIRREYTDAALADGYWPTVKPLVERWDAALATPAAPPRVETEIRVGDVIKTTWPPPDGEYRLVTQAGVADWNSVLRDRVRAIYRRVDTVPPPPTTWQADVDPNASPMEQVAEALRQKAEQERSR